MPAPLSRLVAAARGARVVGRDDVAVAVENLAVVDLAYDSRRAGSGTLFFCVPGTRADGHDHAPAAVAAGAAALVVERPLDLEAPQILVPSVRAAMGPIASAFYDHPSRAMTLIGVTGTNGKTTTAFMLESVFRAMGVTPGVVGTVETHIGDLVEPVTRTTPESIDLQRLFARMRDAGVRAAAMEVSSHGLELGRVAATSFACAIFTNLSQDHLDWHGTMESYYRTKAGLFTPAYAERAVINVGDDYGRRLARETTLPIVTFSIAGDADVSVERLKMDAAGSRVTVRARGASLSLRVPLPARYNVANALGVVGAALSLGWPLDRVVAGIEAMPGVPGRLERIDESQGFTVLVDYAHTPDSLEGVLRAAREFTPAGARLICVFGCGGDRDRGKRPLMGRIAVELADRVILTSDNPRGEDPRAIIAEIESGAREAPGGYDVEPDRRAAIERAITEARPGDVVVIAGKGHESGQEFADRTIPFDDRDVAREAIGRG